MLVYKEIHIKFKNLRLLALSMISLHKPEDIQSKKNEKKYDLVESNKTRYFRLCLIEMF